MCSTSTSTTNSSTPTPTDSKKRQRRYTNSSTRNTRQRPKTRTLRRLLCTDEVIENDFYQYRDLLKWFHYGCYFNLGNNKILRQSIEKRST